MTKFRSSLVAAAVLLSFGCSAPSTGPGLSWDCCGMGGGGPYNSWFTLTYPYNILSGDTVRISAIASSGDTRSTWEITGPAVFVIGPGTTATQITSPVADVLILGSGTGAVRIKAIRANTTDSAATSFWVADASEVTLRIVQGKTVKLQVGAEQWIVAHLLDGQGRFYRGSVTWTSSDTVTVTLANGFNPFGKFARGRAVGVANVIVAFLAQRDTARAEVVP